MPVLFLADSRFVNVHISVPDVNVVQHVVCGSRISDHTRYVHELADISSFSLFVICLGINDIKDYIPDHRVSSFYDYVTVQFTNLVNEIRQRNITCKIIIGTVPPKHLKRSIRKYPTHSALSYTDITPTCQQNHEQFVMKLNSEFIHDFNESNTGVHLALHTHLRTHRSRGRISRFNYFKLYDGLHPSQSLKHDWVIKIQDTIARLL